MSAHLGLSSDEARRLLEQWGPNLLPEPPRRSRVRQILDQFANPLVLALLVSAGVAAAVAGARGGGLSAYADAFAILLIVVMNATLGVVQERHAERALRALRRMSVGNARVRRDGGLVEIAVDGVVPGDLLEITPGDQVAADGILVECRGLANVEATLTGESVPADKAVGDAVFMGTAVARGSGLARVTDTGPRTEMGRIGRMLQGIGAQRTPLEERLERFGRQILIGCVLLSVTLLLWGLARGGRSLADLLLEAVSLAVAAIPEGLPAITTITLALGTLRMARHGALVRQLSAVETLGSATVICTDKTGTLTENCMEVREVYGSAADLIESSVLCNHAWLTKDGALGDPTEAALLTYAERNGVDWKRLRKARPPLDEVPFDASRQWMSVTTAGPVAHVKGAVEALLPRCALDGAERTQIVAAAERMGDDGMRVLLIARGDDPQGALRFLGLVGMLDPPRPAAIPAVAACGRAGIRAVMITGDHPRTARAVACAVGIGSAPEETATGSDLDRLDDAALQDRVESLRVVARATPEQKLRLVRALKARGHVVAMTGDGVNDAPALREAHIGVAMGRRGTDVAREAADLVLTDDNFATIVRAVLEGRSIYRNVQKFIFFLLSSNAGLVLAVFLISFVDGWPPLTPLMILWINLVTNGLPALALGVDPTDEGVMAEAPRRRNAPLLNGRDAVAIAYVGLWMALAALVPYVLEGPSPPSHTEVFTILALAPLFHAWSCRSPRASVLAAPLSLPLVAAAAASGLFQIVALCVPGLRPVFHTAALDGAAWIRVLALSAAILLPVEAAKWMLRASSAARGTSCGTFPASARSPFGSTAARRGPSSSPGGRLPQRRTP